jgi:hypothetical protein
MEQIGSKSYTEAVNFQIENLDLSSRTQSDVKKNRLFFDQSDQKQKPGHECNTSHSATRLRKM